MAMDVCIVCGCIHAIMAELSICDKDRVVRKAWNNDCVSKKEFVDPCCKGRISEFWDVKLYGMEGDSEEKGRKPEATPLHCQSWGHPTQVRWLWSSSLFVPGLLFLWFDPLLCQRLQSDRISPAHTRLQNQGLYSSLEPSLVVASVWYRKLVLSAGKNLNILMRVGRTRTSIIYNNQRGITFILCYW